MELLSYVWEQALVLIPVLMIIGKIVKETAVIPSKWIPLLLLPCGIGGAVALMGVTVEAVLQGVLVSGAAVYGNQIVKQWKKDA